MALDAAGLIERDIQVENRPFAGYQNFAACRTANASKKDPDAYCATIMRAVEGKDIDWQLQRDWHNDRVLETFINDAHKDFEGEKLPLEAQIAAMPWFMENGFYEWFHGEGTGKTPVPIGRPLAWRVKDGMVEVRFGIWDSNDVGGHPWIDERWTIIKKYGTRGTSSVTFAPVGPKEIKAEGYTTVLEIPKAWMWSVGWVGPFAASPGATVNRVSSAKAMEDYFAQIEVFRPQFKAVLVMDDEIEQEKWAAIIKAAKDPAAVCGHLWFHGSEAQRGGFEGGTAGRGRGDKPPKTWMDSCLSRVGKALTKGLDPYEATPEVLKSMDDPSAERPANMVDVDLATFVESMGITKLKAEPLLESCGPCRDYVTNLESKGVPHNVAVAAFQDYLDKMVAEKQAKATRKKALEAGNKPASSSGPGHVPGQESEPKQCPDGYHWDGDACVPDEPKVTEEGFKALENEMAQMRQLMARLLKEKITAEAPNIKALRDAIPKALEGAPEDIRNRVMSEIEAALPHDIDTMINELKGDFESTAKAAAERAVKETFEPLQESILDIREKMKLPAGKPRGAVDTRTGQAFQAATDRQLLRLMSKAVQKSRGIGGEN